jgi:hypothetical protein
VEIRLLVPSSWLMIASSQEGMTARSEAR